MALSDFIIFHHLRANILRFAHIGNFLPILLSFVEKKLVNKGSMFFLLIIFSYFLLTHLVSFKDVTLFDYGMSSSVVCEMNILDILLSAVDSSSGLSPFVVSSGVIE